MAIDRQKNNKLIYYTKGFARLLLPKFIFRSQLPQWLNNPANDEAYVQDRVNYYNKLSPGTALTDAPPLTQLTLGKRLKPYFFDSYELARYFPRRLKAHFLFGDVAHIPPTPTFVKSRPVQGGNENAVLLKLNKVRHFIFAKDRISVTQKKNTLVWRGHAHNENRKAFLERFFNHPLCDVGQVNAAPGAACTKQYLSIGAQLQHKFILCLEGNDVASNLKWAMSSNSIAVMPKPKFETWFMEGRLLPGVHYIEIADDFHNLQTQLEYYIEHSAEAERIVHNAHEFVQQFKNPKREKRIGLMVMHKYFSATGQL